MRGLFIAAAVAALGLASSAQAVSYFSLGAVQSNTGWRDPGLAAYDQVIAGFGADGGDRVGYDDVLSSGFKFVTGSVEGSGTAPAGDTSRYMSVQAGGSVLFDLRSYLDSRGVGARSISVYLGSIDASNTIDLIGRTQGGSLDFATPLATITGAGLGASEGEGLVASLNRRLYINFASFEDVGAIRFSSLDAAFEFDQIAINSARYSIDPRLTVPENGKLPAATVAMPRRDSVGTVPEPASWAMMLGGFGLLGAMMRMRRKERSASFA
jgi:hypothetical protein